MKTVDISETIAACDLKVGRCIQMIAFMKVQYVSSRSQGHFLTLTQGYLYMKIKNVLFSETTGPF